MTLMGSWDPAMVNTTIYIEINFLHVKAVHGPRMLQIHLGHDLQNLRILAIFLCTRCFRPKLFHLNFIKCGHILRNITPVHVLFYPKSQEPIKLFIIWLHLLWGK